ncbi:ankyrin repeat domain-containing protein 26-like [Rattus rattus]|uniref:ankyrin repeat domain-containing protein 26-like n=1 Tax=Rattus rattus TaxID=10117 RepID=UPI0013F2DEF3|nr:ankyrin repeat domain-containing protein 26-like [Rattus rattus]
MKKFLDKCSRRSSASGSSTSQRESSQSREQQCWRASSLASPRQLKNYKAFGKIYKAACQGNVTAVRLCLERGKKGVNDRDRNDRTLLHYACAYGHPDIVTLLISWNCDLNLRDSDNSTALIKASQYKQEECATILLKHGADVNASDKNGNTALHYAVWFNNISMTANLLGHNADITIRNEDSFTPVIVALLKNNECVSQFLVDKKAQVPPEADEVGRIASYPHFRLYGYESPVVTAVDYSYHRVTSQESSAKLQTDTSSKEEEVQDWLQRLKRENLKPKVKREHQTEESEQPQTIFAGTRWAQESSPKSPTDAPSREEDMRNRLDRLERRFQKLKDKRQHQLEELEQPQMTSGGTSWAQMFSSQSQTDAASRKEDMLEQLERLKRDFLQLKVKIECQTEELEHPQMTLDGTSGAQTFSSQSRKDAASREEDMLEQLERLERRCQKLKVERQRQIEELGQPQMTLDGTSGAQDFSSQSRKDAASREEDMLEQLERLNRDFLQLKVKIKCQTEESEKPHVTLDGTSGTFSSQSRKDAASREEDMLEQLESSKRDFVQLKVTTERQIEELEQPQMTLDGTSWTFSSQSRKDAASREEDILEQLESSKHDFVQLKVTTERQTEELEQPQTTLDGTSWAQTFSSQSRKDAASREEDMLEQLESSKRDFLQLKVTTERQTEELEQPQLTLDGTSWAQTFSSQSRNDATSREEDILEQLESSKRDFLQLKVTTERQTEELEQPQMTLDGTSWAQTFSSQSQKDAASREEDMLEQLESSKHDFVQLKGTTERQTEESEQPQMTLGGTSWAQTFRSQSQADAASREEDMLEQLERSKRDFPQLKVTKECQTEELEQPQMTLDGTSRTFSAQSRKDAASREEDMLEQLERLKRDFLQLKVTTECQIEELKQPQMTLGGTSWAQTFSAQSRKDAASREEDILEQLERLKRDFLQLKVKTECQTEEVEHPQMTLGGRIWVTEKVDKHQVYRLRATENLNLSREQASEDQNQSAVTAQENRNHRVIHVSENRNHCEVPAAENVMSTAGQEAENLNHNAKAPFPQKQDGKTKEPLVPVKENGEYSELEQENSSLRNRVRQNTGKDEELLKDSIDLATEKLNEVLFYCEQLKNENQLLHQKAEAMTAIQEKHKMLEDRQEMLNQEFLSLETHMQKNMIERREAETLKQEIEEQSRLQLMEVLDGISRFSKTQSQAHEKAEQEKENSFALKISDMECRVKDLESKLCRAQVQEDSVRFKLEVYQQCYLDQLKVTTALTKQINASKNQEEVEEDSTSTRLTFEEELLTHPYTSGVHIPEETGVSRHRHSVEFNGTFTPSLGTSSDQQRVRDRRPKLPSCFSPESLSVMRIGTEMEDSDQASCAARQAQGVHISRQIEHQPLSKPGNQPPVHVLNQHRTKLILGLE